MDIKVKFFAIVRQVVGEREVEVALHEEATVEELWEMLVKRFPPLKSMSGSLKIAVDQDYVPSDTVLRDGDEVALIPPVSGG